MTEKIKIIFNKNIELLKFSDKTITYIRLQDYYDAMLFSTRAIETIMVSIQDIIVNQTYFNESSSIIDTNYVNQMLGNLLEAQENKDYILLADLYETQLNPFILSLQETIISKEGFLFDQKQYVQNLSIIKKKDIKLNQLLQQMKHPLQLLQEYSIEYTSCGLMTLALYDKGKKYYMHSNGQVLHEAGMLAREWFDDDKSEYIIYGLGLGYHIAELMDLDDTISIHVFESDLNIIQLACGFSDISRILSSDRVHVVYDPKFDYLSSFIKNLNENTNYVMHYPSLRNIKDIRIKEQMEDYFVSYSSVNSQLHKLNNNFRKNILQYDEYIDVLKKEFINKDLYIIAAGPSLDKNYMELKNIGGNSIILATGTVFKKLINAGIRPNYVIIIDANEGVYHQIEGVEQMDIPLLFLSTVYHKIAEHYQGKKYLICQEGFKKSEKYAIDQCYSLFQTGGSVSTTALDIGIQFNCNRIICVGLDLAFSDNYNYASDTANADFVKQINLRQVRDVFGNMVGTSMNLDIYRKWIERRIKNIKEIEFIDATEGGAKIAGMKDMKLKEVYMSPQN